MEKNSEKIERPKIPPEYMKFLLAEIYARKPRGLYEKLCKFAEKINLRPPKQFAEKLNYDVIYSGLNVTPKGVFSASFLLLFIFSFLCFFFSFLIAETALLVVLGALPIFLFWYVFTYPSYRAEVTRIQASNEAIKLILYMVIYLTTNPSFEGAVHFAVQHSKGPISDDLRKAFWDIEAGKYTTIEEALGFYSQKWAWWNEEFVRSLNLLHSVLAEPTESGREEILKKALNYILVATHRKMKAYVEEISSPIQVLHVLGLLLPALGIVMFPMIAIFLQNSVSVPQLIIGYVIFLPILNLFFVNRLLRKRPGAFMAPDISKHPDLPPPNFFVAKIGRLKLQIPIFLFSLLMGTIIMAYGASHFINLAITASSLPPDAMKKVVLEEAGINVKNFAVVTSFVGGFATFFALNYYLRSVQRIKIRNEIKEIERDFTTCIFSLGNFFSEGYPIEFGIGKAIEEYKRLGMEKRPTYGFLVRLYTIIRNFGASFKSALFGERFMLIKHYYSALIEDCMSVLADASEKGSRFLGMVAKTLSTYLENMFTIEDRIKELLAETRSSIKLQASFVVPLINGIIMALSAFIVNMLRILAEMIGKIQQIFGISFAGMAGKDLLTTLIGNYENMVPSTLLQAVIGIYTVEAITIFSMLLSGIESGIDPVARDWEISNNLIKGMALFFLVYLVALLAFGNILLSVQA
jgi:hypothetical protein